MEERAINAAIAGLMHDIGKLEQRAADEPRFPPSNLEKEGQPVHAAFTQVFIDGIPERYRPAARAGVYHHNPQASPAQDKSLSELIALADKLSAGERSDEVEEKGAYPNQMVTIFDRLNARAAINEPGRLHFLPLRPLALQKEALFSSPAQMTQQKDAYLVLRDLVRKQAGRNITDPQAYLENLLGALQQAAWCVPSAYYHSIPDVSLYDHARMTAALAVCLSGKPKDEIKALLAAKEREFYGKAESGDSELLEKPAACLVGGDISGVQDFIYTISSKGAARMLRGRSFYLQLLTEAVLRYLLARLGLPYTNVIYSGGGNFFLLAPSEAVDILPGLRAEVSKVLLRHHGISLYLALGSAVVPASGFKAGKLPEYWSTMHRELNHAKQQRYRELGQEMMPLVFTPPQTGGNPEHTCTICGDDQRPMNPWDELEAQERICDQCLSFVDEIGKDLPDSRFIAFGWEPPQESKKGRASDILAEFGMRFQLLENTSNAITLKSPRLTIWAFDDPPNEAYPESNSPASHQLRFLANQVPGYTFDELQKEVEGGFEKLGVLRLDLDNVGEIFRSGLGEHATLSRLAALSFQISLFFEGWIKKICDSGRRKDLVYTVYTGGDDAFLVGPWDIMPELALDISQQFNEYTGGHPDLHMSTGMSFIGGKYPIYQAAEDALQALEDAKGLDGKDAFTFLGKAWKWSDFKELKNKSQRLEELVTPAENGGMGGSQSILHHLQELSLEANEHKENRSRHVWGRWIWLGHYQLYRLSEMTKGEKLKQAIQGINQDLHKNNYSDIDQWGAASRWVQLKIRKVSGKE